MNRNYQSGLARYNQWKSIVRSPKQVRTIAQKPTRNSPLLPGNIIATADWTDFEIGWQYLGNILDRVGVENVLVIRIEPHQTTDDLTAITPHTAVRIGG